MIQSYRDLVVWQKAMDLVERAYLLSEGLPPTERFGLAGQMRRAAVSIPANIAEGHARTRKEYRNFLSIARGSVCELETLINLALRLQLVAEAQAAPLTKLLDEIGRMLTALRSALQKPPGSSESRSA